MNRGEFLKSWRTDAGFSAERVAKLANLELAVVAGIESGARQPSFEELDALAAVLGLRAEELYEDTIPASAPLDGIRLLMKSAEAYNPNDRVRSRMLEAAAAGRDLLELQAGGGSRRAGFEQFTSRPLVASKKPPFQLGDELALEVRKKLAIKGPIESMRDLATETLGIPIIAANLTADGPDAFSVYAPGRRAVIVLNLDGRNTHGMVRRFSLAHDIGHVLFDRPGAGAFGRACRVDPAHDLDVEARANAFAARLILPYPPVKKLGHDVLEPEHFRNLMETWGIHFSALALYVEKTFKLSQRDAKRDIPEVDRSCPSRWAEAEELPAERKGLEGIPVPRRGPLTSLVLRLLREDKISRARARELLGMGASSSIDELALQADEA